MKHARILSAVAIVAIVLAAMLVSSCSKNAVSDSPSSSSANVLTSRTTTTSATAGGPPGYEPAYVNGTTVRINAIEVKQNPTQQAQADFYEVVYPFDPATGQELSAYWPGLPQCNPCDHQGNGITPDDFHDHVLDSQPSNPGHGAYNALWHVNLIMPNYTGSVQHNTAVNEALQAMLPAKSEAAIDAMLATQIDGIPIAVEIDTHFYFICDVVSANAGSH